MDEDFFIYTDRLREGEILKIEQTVLPDFLEVSERDLTFNKPVKISGEAYVSEEDLILHFSATTEAVIPCKICNTPVSTRIGVEQRYHTVPLKEIHSGRLDLREVVREHLLLEVPSFVECNGGRCKEREALKSYLKKHEEEYHPFEDLSQNKEKR